MIFNLVTQETTLTDSMRSKTWIVLPAYNAEATLQETVSKIPSQLRSRVILVDDGSWDRTVEIAVRLNLVVLKHDFNKGYGANQKTCYKEALSRGAEVVVMLHPDAQYDPRVVGIMSDLITLGNADMVIGNRIRNRRDAIEGGMPVWKYLINRVSTLAENFILGQSIGDFHSGLRAYSKALLESIPFELNNNSFGFDQEFIIQASALKFRIGEVPVPTRYSVHSSSISLVNSLEYGVVGIRALLKYFVYRTGMYTPRMFKTEKL